MNGTKVQCVSQCDLWDDRPLLDRGLTAVARNPDSRETF